jgi:hypothetical protein
MTHEYGPPINPTRTRPVLSDSFGRRKTPFENPTKCNFSEFENLKIFSPEFPEFFLFEYEAHICYNKPI